MIVIIAILAWLIGIGPRAVCHACHELAERRRFARDLDRWIGEMGLE
jgi:hypothetical protein